ncbi:unnamed protein product [Penicillium salamii]|nr:unnamed protein product [Penicillium salamii]CAG8221888.1 unnamed protein product [Penicillium salamii]
MQGKVRHKKCDEAPGSCKNCTSTGRSCEYDLQRLPRCQVSTDESGELRLCRIPDGIRWAVTTDERRCYSYFKSDTISNLAGFFDSALWQEILPQRSVSDPAVYHAVVALSAVHHDLETCGLPLPGQDLQNVWNQFALDQCGRSFTLLSRRPSSQDPLFIESILLCCLVLVLTQLLRSQYDEAFRHLQCGLNILAEAQRSHTSVAQCIVAAFDLLEIQFIQYGARDVVLGNRGSGYQTYILDTPEIFVDVQEARRSHESILGDVFRFLAWCGGLSEEDIILNYETLHRRQLDLLSQCDDFGSRFELFCGSKTFSPKEQRGADIMRLMQSSLTLNVKTCLLRDETALNYYAPEHDRHISMAAEIMTRFPDRPRVTLDIGIIPPVYAAAMWCRDQKVRRRAIKVLRSWPHREGSFESGWAAWVATEQLKAEMGYGSDRFGESGPHSKSEEGRWSGLEISGFSMEGALKSTKCMQYWPCVQAVRQAGARMPNGSPYSPYQPTLQELTFDNETIAMVTGVVA